MLCRRRYYRSFSKWDITIDELKAKVLQGAVIIDVRSNQEYNEGHIQGAINIPEYEIVNTIQKEIPKKNQLIIAYCQYGGRSKEAVDFMRKIGYTNVYNLYGGLEML